MSNVLQEAFDRLMTAYGPQGWWPGDTPLEVAVGAILTQNTNWNNVKKAIDRLHEADAMSVTALAEMPEEELAELIRPAGYYRVKTRRLKNFLQVVIDEFDGSVEAMLRLEKYDLRATLLRVHGIGPETADSIALYAAQKPIFVVDTYTARVLKRHGWIDLDANYDDIQDRFHHDLAEDVELFNEFHALIVRVGKDHCKPAAKCDGCPLETLLPETGPIENEW